jgi:predicted acylesterase/phospholipase RssA
MFGAYQAGVWDELSRVWQPDIVVGASVGSLNGCCITTGYSGGELVERWLDLESVAQVKWQMRRFASGGLLDSSALERTAQEICSHATFQTEFGVVATEFRTMRPVLFRSPNLTWEHIAASCAVPWFLPPRLIDGTHYCDGGLVHPLPLWAAVEMGATRIVAVNLLKTRPWYIRTVVRTLQARSGYTVSGHPGIDIIEISPQAPLGSARDSMYWKRANAERWIVLGRADAQLALASVLECGQEFGRAPFYAGRKGSQVCSFTAFSV